MNIDAFFSALWHDYVEIAPRAAALKAAFEARGERVVNDHVAFRTLDRAPIDIAAFEPHLLAMGYTRHEPYDFADKKLNAWSYLPPSAAYPRVFFSELRTDELSPEATAILDRLVAQIDPASVADPSALFGGRPWPAPSFAEYERLLQESEYAAWVAAIGLRANHFTIAIHELEAFDSVESVLAVVEAEGHAVNTAGGRVKGSPDVLLEQASTMADLLPVVFADAQTRVVPTCYYEFALRHRDASGALYEGFVPASADKIFESTNVLRSADSPWAALGMDLHAPFDGVRIGERDAGAAGPRCASTSPIDGATIAEVQWASVDDADRVAAASLAAFRSWRKVPAPQRGALVRRVGEHVRRNKETLAAVITLEVGKTTSEALGEVQEWVDMCEFAVGLSRQLHGLTIVSERPAHRMMEQWHPLGPVAVISAFNFPMAVWAWNAMLALVCGDSVVWKPSEKAPLCAIAAHRMVERAIAETEGAPHGLSSLLIGGADVGEALSTDARYPLVSATGSVRMGKAVGGVVGGRLGRCLLELGGNNAAIVAPSADLELAIRGIVFAAAGTCGQRCTTLRRLIVHRSRIDELTERLRAAYATLAIGDPREPGVLVGPLIDEDAALAFDAALQTARDQGGDVLVGGARVHGGVPSGGAYVAPALVRIAPYADIVQHETFAPILYVMPYDTLEEAIAIQNDVPQGLSSAIFTESMREAERFVGPAGSDCGIANVNIGTSGAEIGGAFGGEKDTGGGRESGSDAWKNYMRRTTNTVNYGDDLPLAQGVEFSV